MIGLPPLRGQAARTIARKVKTRAAAYAYHSAVDAEPG
jgi:hypothetical protein